MHDTAKPYVTTADVSVRMFRSGVLETLSHVHPAVPHLLFLPVVAWCLWAAPTTPARSAALVLGGVLLWTLVEYLVHRFLFHPGDVVMEETHAVVARLAPGEPVLPALPSWRHRLYFIAHGVHHEYPSDSTRLVIPPGASVPLAALFYLVFRAVAGAAAPALFAGFVLGYLAYDTIHFAVHHQGLPTAWGRYLKRRHARHHFVDADEDYGVSTPLWDVVLGTFSGGPAHRPAAAEGGRER
jgi:sterol desaturase/sphingolipid hydroxylase (fatty acid hydroxylase superfamily)